MSALTSLLDSFRGIAASEREKGTYFEDLILAYLQHEPSYRDLYSHVWTYGDWAEEQGLPRTDAGIDLVAQTAGTNEFHAIQCKLYDADYRLKKSDIDSFFTASGKSLFSHRIVVSTTSSWTEHAEEALRDQNPPVSKIDLQDLEASLIDWSAFEPSEPPPLKALHTLRPHQERAHDAVVRGLEDAERGKLIMACGSGKTFTSLKIAETIAGAGQRVLFLVPSLSLLSQALTEWTQESGTPLHSFAVCSDVQVGKRKRNEEDRIQTYVHELRYPATTEASRLAEEMKKRHDAMHMSVVFSTYHSIEVLSEAQKEYGLGGFDLVICDEAHRTTGATFAGEDESAFVRVHDEDFLQARKRLYMTATPRIYGTHAKATAERDDIALYSMDDADQYGDTLHVLTFSEAVKRDLLVDYKVIVLAVEEKHVSRRLQSLLADEDNQLKVDDASKIVGCWKALAKLGLSESLAGDDTPMRRAVAFCQVIEPKLGARTHKVSSKNIANMFQTVVDEYRRTADEEETLPDLRCETDHIDGSMNASGKEEKLKWLKTEPESGACKILSNVRCLSEGVDVPALDAVLFLTPRSSQVDVVQSVGRVMRKAPGKKRGYVILPVVIPAGVEPHEALNDNETYRVVWQVLQALRSHDDRFDAMINKLDLIGKDPTKMEVIAVRDKIQNRSSSKTKDNDGKGQFSIGSESNLPRQPVQEELEFEIGEIERALYAKLVQKVGNRHHWEEWANDIARIASIHITRISTLLENPDNAREREAFGEFAAELRDDLNDAISDDEIVEMLAQHLITKPVFDALFEEHSFAKNNPISKAMQKVLDILQEHHLDKEADTLQAFYESVHLRAEGIDSAAGKQKIVVELYDKFFRNAFPKMTERLGIVYTPVEIVDFILKSVSELLEAEFNQTLSSKDVHIIDPFTGTGTFITRLLQSGLIAPESLPYKYNNEIHANEIVLLAYYIAAINIEAVYHDLVSRETYEPFPGICLTDTFQMYERDDLFGALLPDNSERRKRQKELDIRIVVGNPPYSVGQGSQNDNNQNVEYPQLDARIGQTYVERSDASLSRGLYDSYVRAIRWATDRIGESGILAYVTNAGFLDARFADGLRRCLAEGFSDLYVFHLRGNARTSGERRRKEKGNVFGEGCRAPAAITILVKNPEAEEHGRIYFHDIGDYLSRDEKLERVQDLGSVAGVSDADGWRRIEPDEHGDWLNQRDAEFTDFLALGDKDEEEPALFESYSLGVVTNRDAWCYNSSRTAVAENMQRMIDFYNSEVDRFMKAYGELDTRERRKKMSDFIDTDPKKISWTRALKRELVKGEKYLFDESCLTSSMYRPYMKQWLYFNRVFNEVISQMPRLFPTSDAENIVIGVSASKSRSGWSVYITDCLPSLHATDMVGSQYFPLYLYDEPSGNDDGPQEDLFRSFDGGSELRRRSAITSTGLNHFRSFYDNADISAEDIFYYVYGLLNSPDYREAYATSLGKELPRIPRVQTFHDFQLFSKAGRDLADLHCGYETEPMYPAKLDTTPQSLKPSHYRVSKMRFGKTGGKKDRSKIVYNEHITVTGIPPEAYDYVVSGRSAIEWLMDRQRIKEDTRGKSGIVNDSNDWAVETMNNPKYPLELLLRIIHVSLETVRIVQNLPRVEPGN